MKKGCKGSLTIELAYLMPLFFLMFLAVVYTTFYFHDKNILYGAAYETAVMGGQVVRMEEKEVDVLNGYLKQRVGKKLILFGRTSLTVQAEEEQVIVEAAAAKGRMRVQVTAMAAVTQPEKQIRIIRAGKELVTGGGK